MSRASLTVVATLTFGAQKNQLTRQKKFMNRIVDSPGLQKKLDFGPYHYS